MLCTAKHKFAIKISYTSQFSPISVLYRKEWIISVNININNFTVNFKGDIVVKLSSWFCGWIESTFCVYLPFIVNQFVTRVGVKKFMYYLKLHFWTLHQLNFIRKVRKYASLGINISSYFTRTFSRLSKKMHLL